MSSSILGDVALVSNGKTPPVSEQRESGFPVLKIRDVDALGNFRGPFASFVDGPFAERFRAKHLQQGDTLILNAAHNADYVASKMFYAKSSLGGPLVTGEWTIVRPNPAKADTGYVHHFIESTTAKQQLKEMVNGIHLYPKDVARLALPLPPLPEQRRIAAILDKADALRAKRREAIAKLDQLLQAVFLEMFGDPVANPREWPIGCIGDMLESVKYGTSEKASPDGPVPILRMNNITAIGEMELTDLKYVNLPTKELEKYLVRPGDLLFNRTNSKELVGKTAVYDGPEPMAFAGYLVRGRVSDRYSPEYISAYLNSRWGKQKLRGMCKSIVGMANINAQEFAGISIAIPSSEAQQRFARLVSGMRARKRDLREQMRAFDRLFSALQSNAFSEA